MRDGRATAYRTVLISDLHLGSYRCDAGSVLDFLATHHAETLYLVGDVIDFWSFRRHMTWRSEHVAVMRRLLELARAGTRVILIPGNHDGPLQHLAQFGLEGIEVRHETTLITASGERLLVAHGHEQDPVFGSGHELIALFCGIGEMLQLGRWWMSAIGALSKPVRTSNSRFERALVEAARRVGADGVICGHSHLPADRMIDGVRYLNCGDWIRNCTAVVESWSGELELVRWRPGTAATTDGDAPLWADGETAAAVAP